MNSLPVLVVAALGFLCGACSSGNISGRNDYSSAHFDSRNSKRAAREMEIRKLYLSLTEDQMQQKLAVEFPVGLPKNNMRTLERRALEQAQQRGGWP